MGSDVLQPAGERLPEGGLALRPFDRYFLVRKLAEGGMAEIFLAKLQGVDGFERNVVIKRLLAHLSQQPDVIDMFRDEARLASQLLHPNVVQILELGFAEGCYFIAMEYLAGEDFSKLLRTSSKRRAWVPTPIVLRVIAEAARGLAYAHEFADAKGHVLGIVHRDISPSNLFITYSGQVKVVDFGIARAESRLATTSVGMVKGKYQYMSPEQASSGKVDHRTDIYALGVSLYEALTLRRAFARENDLAVLKAVMANDYVRPSQLRPELPPELCDIVTKAMARLPEDRFQSATALAEAIEQFLTSTGESCNGTALGGWLQAFFGPEEVQQKTRIPSLDELRGLPVPASTPAAPRRSRPGAQTLPSLPEPTRVVETPGTSLPSAPALSAGAPSPPTQSSRSTLLTILGVSLLAGLTAAVTTVILRPTERATGDAGVLVIGQFASVADASVGAGAVDVSPRPETHDGGAEATASEPEARDAGDARSTTSVVRPVKLTVPVIAAVVRRNASLMTRCFESFKADLASDTGMVPVTITVGQSGRVTRASSPLAGTPVGQCLERQARALRFPAHLDVEVTVTMPFQWQVQR